MAEGSRGVSTAPRAAARAPGREMAAFLAAFDEAARRKGVVERRVEVCGQRLLLRFAGDAMVGPQTEALAHHPQWVSGEAELTVSAMDTASTGVMLPDDGRRQKDSEGVFQSFGLGNAGVSTLDPASRNAAYWLPDAALTPNHDRGAPFRVILGWWLGLHEVQLMHCSAVGDAEGSLLIVGRGGSGKSTTSLSCLAAGWGFLGDDYCAVDMNEERPAAWSLYSLAKLSPESLSRIPALSEHIVHPESMEDEKYLLSLAKAFRDQILVRSPLRAILVPRIAGGSETRFTATRGVAALAALAPSTLLQQAPPRDAALKRMRDIVAAVPCFEVLLSADTREVPAALRRFSASLAPGGGK